MLPVCKSYTGIEPSKHACEYASQKNILGHFYNNTLDALIEQLRPQSFDTVVMWDVIEHLPDPINTLRMINHVLKPGGHVIYSTINIESTFSIGLGPYWPWFMDMHYYYFSDRGYADMFSRSGFVLCVHEHYLYYVNLSYFINKVMSIVLGKIRLPITLEKILCIPIRIRFGDTVAVVGKKLEGVVFKVE